MYGTRDTAALFFTTFSPNRIFAYCSSPFIILFMSHFRASLIYLQDLNTALDEALEDYDLATKWLDGKNRPSGYQDGKK